MKKSILIVGIVFHSMNIFSQDKDALTHQLDSLFSSYYKTDEPGGTVLIMKDGKELYKNGFGLADLKTKKKISSQTVFNLGSITKTFVAYGILKLASEQRLSIEDDLYKFFPDFTEPSIAHKVKLYHLLTHSSGLPDSRKVSENREFYLWAKDEENFAPLKKTEALEFEPGSHYKYSNPAFNGLALVIEKNSGRKWQDYITDLIFKPAGMIHSTITDGPHPQSGVAHAYEKNEKGEWMELDYGEEPTFPAAGNGGVWSNVEELWKYEQAIQQNKFLSREWIDRSRTPFPLKNWSDSTTSRLGLSWFLTTEHGHSVIGHTGTQGGFYCDYCWLPVEKIFYIFLSNRQIPRQEIKVKVFHLLKLD